MAVRLAQSCPFCGFQHPGDFGKRVDHPHRRVCLRGDGEDWRRLRRAFGVRGFELRGVDLAGMTSVLKGPPL